MGNVRFFLMVAFVSTGAAMMQASYVERPLTAVWVGGGSHDSQSLFFGRNGLPSATLELRTASK